MTWQNNFYSIIPGVVSNAYDTSKSYLSKYPLQLAGLGALAVVTVGSGGVLTYAIATGLLAKGAISAAGNAWEGLKKDVVKEPHESLLSLKSQLSEIIEKPDTITPDKVRELQANLTLLSANDGALVGELASQLRPHGFTLKMIREIAENKHLDTVWELLNELKEPSKVEDLRKLAQFIDSCIIDQTGYLPNLINKVDPTAPQTNQPADDGKGIISQGMTIIGKRFTKNKGNAPKEGTLLKQLENARKLFTIENVIKQPPKELRPLQPLLTNYLNDPNERTVENIKKLHERLVPLTNNDNELLKQIAPDLSHEQLLLCNFTFEMVEEFSNDAHLDVNQLSQEEVLRCLHAFNQLVASYMDKNKGFIVQLLDSVDPTIPKVTPPKKEDSLLSRVGEVIKEEFTQRNFTKEAATEFATKKINESTSGGFNFVKKGIGGLFGKPTTNQPTDGPRVVDVTNDPEASTEEGTISQFLSYGISYLKGMAGNGGGFLSKLAASTFAGWLISGVNLFLPEMRKANVPEQAVTAFEQILSSLTKAQESGDFSAVISQMEAAGKVMKENNIIMSVHGFQIPLIGAPSEKKDLIETSYSDNIALLKEAINAPLPPPAQNQNWENLALEENTKLVYNISNFLALKHIYEDVCGLKPDYETFYLTLIAQATKNGSATSTKKLKELLLQKLEEKNVGYLRRVWAGWKFSGFRLLTKKYTAKAVTVYFKEIFKYISENKSDDFNTLRKMMMTNFTGYLTTLGGAYSSIANDPRPSGTKEQMLENELSKKESNRGFEPLELYKELARTVIAKMTGEGIFSWITWQLTKLFLDPAQIVKELVDTSTTMQDVRGYSHALNSVIREELDEIWDLLRAEHLNPQTDTNPAVPNEVSEGNRKQMSALVKNLFEVLGKGKCDTLDELRRLLAEKDMTAKINQTIDGFYIPDVIDKISALLAVTIESLAKEDQLQKLTYKFSSLLNQSFVVGNVVTQEEMQDEERKIAKRSEQILLYAVNAAINDLYDTSGKKQQAETNRFITDLQKQSDRYFNGSQTLSGAKQDLIDLARMQDIASLEAKNKINKITEEALAYANYCHETDLAVKSAQLSSSNKEEVSKRCLSIAEKSSPFIEAVAKLKTHSNSLEDIRTGAPHLQGIEAVLADLGLKLFNNKTTLTAEDIAYAEARVQTLEGHTTALKKMRDSKKSLEQISTDMQQVSSLSRKLESAGQDERLLAELKADLLKYWNSIKKTNAEITIANLKKQGFIEEQKRILQQNAKDLNELFDLNMGLSQIISQTQSIATILVDLTRANATKLLQEELIKPNSIFDQIVYEKKQHIGKLFKNAELDTKVASLKQKLLGSVPSAFRTKLLDELKIIHEAPIEAQVIDAQRHFLDYLSQAVDKSANPIMADERVKYYTSFNTIREGAQRTHLLDQTNVDRAKRGVYEATAEAGRLLETLSAWQKAEIKPISYINFCPMDLKGPQDITSGIIYGRVREHMNGFLSFLKRDDTYRYGLLHHLFLIPYIQARKGPKV